MVRIRGTILLKVAHLTKCCFDNPDQQQTTRHFCDKQAHFGTLDPKMIKDRMCMT